jgi:hypothetical protein
MKPTRDYYAPPRAYAPALHLRVAGELRDQIVEIAAREERTPSAVVRRLLRRALAAIEQEGDAA